MDSADDDDDAAIHLHKNFSSSSSSSSSGSSDDSMNSADDDDDDAAAAAAADDDAPPNSSSVPAESPNAILQDAEDKEDATFSGKRVIVIGAGVSGLAAARRLRYLGYQVVVLVGRQRIGGRIHTTRHSENYANPGKKKEEEKVPIGTNNVPPVRSKYYLRSHLSAQSLEDAPEEWRIASSTGVGGLAVFDSGALPLQWCGCSCCASAFIYVWVILAIAKVMFED
jgi:hypothetical protein